MSDPILLARLDALELNLARVEEKVISAKDQYQLDDRIWGTFYDAIAVPARQSRTGDLRTIRRKLASAADGDSATREAEVREAWNMYRNVYQKGERIFADCVEFLGGLALRETGLDEGICQLADELMERCDVHTGADWRSLTIPTLQERMTVSLARIIRLRFPEWTIWTLPLAAHQFGRLVVELKENWREQVRDLVDNEDDRHRLHDLLADGLGVYLLGPAYACAAIRLSFDPLTAFTDQDEHMADAKRAYVVLAMLKKMNEKAGVRAPYEWLFPILEAEWREALERARPEQRLAEEDQEWLAAAVDTMWQLFADLRPWALYPPTGSTGWQVARDWSEDLLQGETIEVGGTEPLRDVLNAAWLCRIEQPEEIERITDRALDLCQRIVDTRRKLGTQRDRRVRRIGRR